MRRLLALLLACGLAACGESAQGDRPADGRSGAAAAGGPGGQGGSGGRSAPAQSVDVVIARTERVEDAIDGTGQVEAIQSIQLRPEVEGRIVEILFQEGRMVDAGQPLFRVDDAELRAEVAGAEAERDLAQQALVRQRQLMESQSSTTSDLERAEATARSTQATLDLLRLRLERTVVRAPFAGAAGARMVSLGDFVNNQTRLVTLQTVDPQHVTLLVPERYAEQLHPGLRVTFRVASLRNRQFSGVVDFVDPTVQLPGRTILLKARVPNPRRELQAGMFAEGRLIAAARANAVVVPEDAVLPVQGNTLVFVVRNGRAERRSVELGVRMPGFVEVATGVAAGDTVVVGGAERLTDGAPVRATMAARRGSATP